MASTDIATQFNSIKGLARREMAPFIMPQADGRMVVAEKGAWFCFGAWK